MSNWNLDPSWTPSGEINGGQSFASLDDVSPEDFNKLVENMQYLYRAGGDVELNAYPIGAVYMSKENISPALLFGGDWEQITDKFLLAAGDTYPAGSTGGSADAVLLKHNHNVIRASDANFVYGAFGKSGGKYGYNLTAVKYDSTTGYYHPTGLAEDDRITTANPVNVQGGSSTSEGAGKNMPPYKSYYMWERIG